MTTICRFRVPVAAPPPISSSFQSYHETYVTPGPNAVGARPLILLLWRSPQMLEEERNHVSVEFLVERCAVEAVPAGANAWVKSKCLNRAEFVVVGWSDPEGSRHLVGSLLLGYYDLAGRLIYAGRVGTGMSVQTLAMLHQRLEPLATSKMPLSSPPPRRSRFGGPLALSKVHWVRPQLVAEITYLGWTDEPLLRHTVFVGLREDKPAREVRREVATRP